MQPDIDRIALPLITLWRHYLELILKTMVLALGQAGDLRKKDHKLTELWEVARPLLETLMADVEWEQLDAVGAVVSEFSDLDPMAQLSRYPSDKKGAELFLPRLPSTLDMGHMDETMRGVANFFEGCWAAIGAIREADAEAAAYRSEF